MRLTFASQGREIGSEAAQETSGAHLHRETTKQCTPVSYRVCNSMAYGHLHRARGSRDHFEFRTRVHICRGPHASTAYCSAKSLDGSHPSVNCLSSCLPAQHRSRAHIRVLRNSAPRALPRSRMYTRARSRCSRVRLPSSSALWSMYTATGTVRYSHEWASLI